MSPSLIGRIRTAIATATGHPIGACEARPVGGGDIHESYVLVALTPYFVKVNTARQIGLFEAEAEALREIAATGAIRVPRPIVWDVCKRHPELRPMLIDSAQAASGRCQGNFPATAAGVTSLI